MFLQGYNSSLTMLDGKSKMSNVDNSQEKSSLPNDEISQDTNDLDDEILLVLDAKIRK